MKLRRAILFVKDLPRMRSFYQNGFHLEVVEATATDRWVELEAGGAALALHAIPSQFLDSVEITDPPQPRERTPIKLVFETSDLSVARAHLDSGRSEYVRAHTMGVLRRSGSRRQYLPHRAVDIVNRKDLLALDDELMRDAVFDDLLAQLDFTDAEQMKTLPRFSTQQRAVHTTTEVEVEVNNGGFNQYFFNSKGWRAEMALDGFRAMGAVAHAALMVRAIAMAKGEESVREKARKAINILKAFSELSQESQLHPLDMEFYDLQEKTPLSTFAARFIRENIAVCSAD